MSTLVPKPCKDLQNTLIGLESERDGLQEMLQGAATTSKGGLVAQIRKLNKQIEKTQKALNACLEKHRP
ncbi:CBS domain-containing protein [Archangium lipolyticum]|uniref:hypothetical protein n=1 Tax=Archangium lipolyticum TaxID=2970465 RepID=UPI002149C532|nr:hypothetical protein [Archangium lipolyticum]